jgi:exopolysaccharide production protein ExoY
VRYRSVDWGMKVAYRARPGKTQPQRQPSIHKDPDERPYSNVVIKRAGNSALSVPAAVAQRPMDAADVEVPVPRASEPARPTSAARRSSTNLRLHVWRAFLRITGLGMVDVAAFLIFRSMLRTAHESLLFAPGSLVFVDVRFPEGYFGGWRVCAAMLVSLVVAGNYGVGDRRRDSRRLFMACALAMAVPIWMELWSAPRLVAFQYVSTTLLLTLILVSARRTLDAVTRRYYPSKTAGRTLLVGPGAVCMQVLGRPALAEDNGFDIIGFIDTSETPCAQATGPLQELERVLGMQEVDTIVLCGHSDETTFARVVRAAMVAECELLSVSRSYELAGVSPEVVWRHGHPFIELRAVALRGQQLVLKRLLDIALAGVAVVLLAPVMLVLAAAIRLDSKGPAVFGQSRVGRHGRRFKCYKFRSMHVNADEMLRVDPELYAEYVSNDFKLPPERDKRITRMGAFLRRTSLDELPQLWNVLRGDMSLVGPRPIVPAELCHYGTEEPLFLSLKPGVTGAWQVKGRSNMGYPVRAGVELEYVRKWSLATDIEILVRTLPAVLTQRGAR